MKHPLFNPLKAFVSQGFRVMKKNCFQVLACLIALCLSSSVAFADTSPKKQGVNPAHRQVLRVLTIGNSFTKNAIEYLDEILEADGRFSMVHDQAWRGGCSLQTHWEMVEAHKADPKKGRNYYNRKSLKELLLSDSWDVVVLQQFSVLSDKPESYQPYTTKLVDFIHKLSPDSKIYMHQTWAYRVDDGNNPHGKFVKDYAGSVDPQGDMYRNLRKAYHSVAYESGIKHIIPTGDAFRVARQDPAWVFKYPDPDFDYKSPRYPEVPIQNNSLNVGYFWREEKDGQQHFRFDTHHASLAGQYLGSAVWFEVLFGESVIGNSYVPEGITKEQVSILQRVAHETVANPDNTAPDMD